MDDIYSVLYIITNDILNVKKSRTLSSRILDNEVQIYGNYNDSFVENLKKLDVLGDSIKIEYKITRSVYSGKRTMDFINCKIEIEDRKEVDVILGSLLLYNMISEESRRLLYPDH